MHWNTYTSGRLPQLKLEVSDSQVSVAMGYLDLICLKKRSGRLFPDDEELTKFSVLASSLDFCLLVIFILSWFS